MPEYAPYKGQGFENVVPEMGEIYTGKDLLHNIMYDADIPGVDAGYAQPASYNVKDQINQDILNRYKAAYYSDIKLPSTTKDVQYKDTTKLATEKNNRSNKFSSEVISNIADAAKRMGIDPNTAIATALVETNIGNDYGNLYAANPLHINQSAVAQPRKTNVDHSIIGVSEIVQPYEVTSLGVAHLASLIKKYGEKEGLRRFNGTGDSGYNRITPYNEKVLTYKKDIQKNPDIQRLINAK